METQFESVKCLAFGEARKIEIFIARLNFDELSFTHPHPPHIYRLELHADCDLLIEEFGRRYYKA